MNQVTIAGRLGSDPEIRYFESGKCVAQFNVAVSRYNGKDKEKTTDWFTVKAWSKLAELIGEKFRKGDFICVSGNMQQETWEKDNQKHSKHVVNVERLNWLPGSGSSSNKTEDEGEDF